ncbi:uncharacterized protein LOC116849051 isoform X2 [Odontomachus brunneus]|uniref:uncharacterized protein LOC116849051 isoform X2 n=1 Tax=Odontomachus brunneus TaxID=486640 RepID=UPI0013F2A79B|nr:uncharacterized protein LOC116849051 isoform X2 [Odontomachus brunneus]
MKRRMTWFPRSSRRLSDLWQLTLWRKLGALEKSKDCPSSPTVEDAPETRSSASSYHPSTDDGPSEDPCSLSPSPEKQDPPPCPCPKPPTCHPDSDPRRLVLWRTLSLVVALPLVVIMSAYTYARQLERAKEPRPPFLNLPYMYRRTKPYPWGDGNHTLFHNPVKNAIPPHGYEVEDPNEKYRKKTDN